MFCYQVILSALLILHFFSSAGAVHPAGSVPRRGGGRDGREAQPLVVGGLANSGPCPAQPGRSGPGKFVRTLQKTTETRKWHSEQNGGWKEEQKLITFQKYWSTGSENLCHVGTFVFMFMSFLFLRLFVLSSKSRPDASNSHDRPRTCQGVCLGGTGSSPHSERDRDELWHVFRAGDLSSCHNTQQRRSVESWLSCN